MTRKGVWAAGLAGTVVLASSASASFTGYVFDSYANDSMTHAIIDVYAQFDDANDTVLNVFNSMISTSTGVAFNHNDFNTLSGLAGAWNVVQSGNIPGVVNASIDSFVLIGGVIGGTNTTSLDPSFDPSTGGSVPTNAGWFNSNPPNLQGRVDAGSLRTWVARFVIEGTNASVNLNFAANLGYNQGLGTPAQFAYDNGQGSGPMTSVAFVPAPGAIALLGLAGLAGRRRRN
jgi:MYXO-CTERM domain-containing protein